MRTLTRHEGESVILLTDDLRLIRIRISSIRGDETQVTIEAPQDVDIYREESLDAVLRKVELNDLVQQYRE